MGSDTVTAVVDAELGALEYREAAWRAHEDRAAPPDPLFLSDAALDALVRYRTTDLPRSAFEAAERELSRRRASRSDRTFAIAMFAVLALSAIAIAFAVLTA